MPDTALTAIDSIVSLLADYRRGEIPPSMARACIALGGAVSTGFAGEAESLCDRFWGQAPARMAKQYSAAIFFDCYSWKREESRGCVLLYIAVLLTRHAT